MYLILDYNDFVVFNFTTSIVVHFQLEAEKMETGLTQYFKRKKNLIISDL